MKIIHVGCQLDYEVQLPTTFIFSIAAATTEHQRIRDENLDLTPQVNYEWFPLGEESNRSIRFAAQPGKLSLKYQATVQLVPELDHIPNLHEISHLSLPTHVLPYLNPSRYCESDRLARFALQNFGDIEPGYTRVKAICDWVYEHTDYIIGSTDVSSSAVDVLVQRAGVCRDFAHLSIALCRALGIPARYVAGYAPKLQPPDFHGFFEAFLGGKWYLFDASRMAPVSGFVRIGAGRDAADASFATLVGAAFLKNMEVFALNTQATADNDHDTTDNAEQLAISTA